MQKFIFQEVKNAISSMTAITENRVLPSLL